MFFVLFLAILAFLAVLQIVLCVTPPVEFCVLEWPLSHDMPSLPWSDADISAKDCFIVDSCYIMDSSVRWSGSIKKILIFVNQLKY